MKKTHYTTSSGIDFTLVLRTDDVRGEEGMTGDECPDCHE